MFLSGSSIHFHFPFIIKQIISWINLLIFLLLTSLLLLNAVNVQITFLQSADILPWHPDDDDSCPAYQNRECCVKRIRIDTSAFISDLYPDPEFDDDVYERPVFAGDDIPIYDSPTKVNLLNISTMNDYWFQNPITKNDPTAICGQFDSGADATVTNLLIYSHNYRPHTTRFKCPVSLTGAVGTTDIYSLGEGFLYMPAPTPSGYLGVCCFYSPHLTSTLVSPQDILKTSNNWKTGFSGQDIKTYFGTIGDPNFE